MALLPLLPLLPLLLLLLPRSRLASALASAFALKAGANSSRRLRSDSPG